MASASETKRFFAGVEGNQGSDQPALLPTREKDGAPKGNLWLLNLAEGEVKLEYTNGDGHPYIKYRADVIEPAEYEKRGVYGMFFFPRDIEGKEFESDREAEEAAERYESQASRIVGQIEAILGPGTVSNLDVDNLEAGLENLVSLLQDTAFVGKIGIERGKKKDPNDESKDAERYPDRNKISFFYPADTWQGAG